MFSVRGNVNGFQISSQTVLLNSEMVRLQFTFSLHEIYQHFKDTFFFFFLQKQTVPKLIIQTAHSDIEKGNSIYKFG